MSIVSKLLLGEARGAASKVTGWLHCFKPKGHLGSNAMFGDMLVIHSMPREASCIGSTCCAMLEWVLAHDVPDKDC